MKRTAILVLILLAVTLSADAGQARKRTTPGRGAAAAKAGAARRAAAERIVGQITTISNFLYVYGSVVKGIQTSEQTSAGASLPSATQALIEKNKAGVVDSLHNIAENLRRMEMDFGEDAGLKAYYQNVNKLSEDVGLAADAAGAGKYDDAGKRLLSVVENLSRALLPESQ